MNPLEPFYYELKNFLKREYGDRWHEKMIEITPYYDLIKKFSERRWEI
jgi:hypothetical protein